LVILSILSDLIDGIDNFVDEIMDSFIEGVVGLGLCRLVV
jgi:hypothetical protein